SQFVAVPGKFINEQHEASGLADSQDLEHLRAEVVKLGRQRRTLPIALVQPPAKVRPLPDMARSERLHGGRRGTQKRNGERRRFGGHSERFAAEALDRVPGGIFRVERSRPEVFDRGFPRSQAEGREFDAGLRPYLQLRWTQTVLKRPQTGFKMLFQRRRKPRKAFVVPGDQFSNDAHALFLGLSRLSAVDVPGARLCNAMVSKLTRMADKVAGRILVIVEDDPIGCRVPRRAGQLELVVVVARVARRPGIYDEDAAVTLRHLEVRMANDQRIATERCGP